MVNQKVCVIGDNCVGIYPDSGNSYVEGNGINSAIALKRNGIDTGYIGVIGNDEESKLIITDLEKEEVDYLRVFKQKKPNSLDKNRIKKSDRIFIDESLGVQHFLNLFEEDYV